MQKEALGAATNLPVAVIGAGPVGLAAAAHMVRCGLAPVVFEQGAAVGTAVRAWGHVKVYTPWRYIVDDAARELLAETGWKEPAPEHLPTGHEIVDHYLEPLERHEAIAAALQLKAKVVAVTRLGLGKLTTAGREGAPFVVHWVDSEGKPRRTLAQAVLDASGSWGQPNPLGADGYHVPGEAAASDRISYGIPDVSGTQKAIFAGQRVLVVGGGDSALTVVLDLLKLREEIPETRILWALRRQPTERLFGGGEKDALPARGALGLAGRRIIEEGHVELLTPFAIEALRPTGEALTVAAQHDGRQTELKVDHVVAATGFRPDLTILRELRIAIDPVIEAPPELAPMIDPVIEAPPELAPMIDPNVHSCGTVPPHGVKELTHPESRFYIVGMKSYGRAPTFLMPTGYEQVRSVAAELAGDHAAAREVRLVLPETGVCGGDLSPVTALPSCCGGSPRGVHDPAPAMS